MDIENFLASAHDYAETSKTTYRKVIPRVLSALSEDELAGLSPASLITRIQFIKEWGNSRQNVALAACKKYLAWRFGQQHPALTAKIKRVTGKMQRALTEDEIKILLASFNTMKATGARDLAIASLAIDTGLRLSEICRLQQADVDTERRVLQVIVKGGQWETAIFSEQTALSIEHWKKFRSSLSPKGHLFINTFTGEGLDPKGLQSQVREWHKRLPPDFPRFSFHAFRRGMATIATQNGATERDLMLGGRWKSSQMIVRYTRSLRLENMRKYLPLGKDER